MTDARSEFSAPSLSAPASSFTAAIGTGRTEAETLSIGGGFETSANPHASARGYLQATADASSAGGTLTSESALYDLTVGYFDETDGVSRLDVLVDGRVVDSFDWDGTFGDRIVTPAGRAERVVEGLRIDAGDVIELRGTRDEGEPLRIDYLDLDLAGPIPQPQPTAFTVEAEALEIVSGFAVVSNPNASDDAFLVDTGANEAGAGEARAAYTVTQAGTFDLTVGYFDETDGVSSLRVLLNDVEIDAFDWDGTGGTALASPQSRAERTIEGLALEAGDRLEIAGFGDGTEPLRTDFLRFEPSAVEPPEPTPDFWYGEGGQVFVALNDGTGTFAQVPTGIALDPGDAVFARDLDGDGDTDFIRIASDGVRPSVGPEPFELAIEATSFLNDGSGAFAAEPTVTSTLPAGSDDASFRVIGAGDLDGDGDLDLVSTGLEEFTVQTLRNEGGGLFSPLQALTDGPDAADEAFVADLDGDLAPDIAIVPDFPAISGVIYLDADDGTGLQTFAGDAFDVAPERAFGASLLDLDGDGDLDGLYSESGEGAGIRTFINDGTGREAAGDAPFFDDVDGDGGGLVGVALGGNFDGDAAIEVIAAGVAGGGAQAGLRVLEVVDTPTGSEFALQSLDPAFSGVAAASGDFDGDGDGDLLFRPFDDPTALPRPAADLRLLLNDGAANFTDAGVVLPDDAFDDVLGVEVAFFDDGALLV